VPPSQPNSISVVEGQGGAGIGGFDLKSSDDRAFAFDWKSSGKMYHIALYRPGAGAFWVIGTVLTGSLHLSSGLEELASLVMIS
jgi:hypothetical protein